MHIGTTSRLRLFAVCLLLLCVHSAACASRAVAQPPKSRGNTEPDNLRGTGESDPRAERAEGRAGAGEGGEFVLVEEDRPEHPLLVVPTFERFVTKQDYYTNYDDFYHCAKVASGAVRVVRPAVVEQVAEGWRLKLKGELKV